MEEKYLMLKAIGNCGALAVKLARESMFWEVLVQCTVYGAKDLPGFPTEELGPLKQTLFARFTAQNSSSNHPWPVNMWQLNYNIVTVITVHFITIDLIIVHYYDNMMTM